MGTEREDNEDLRQSFVRITNREVYDAIVNLEKIVNSMDARMNNILGENMELRQRVRGLELRFYAILAGMSTAVVAGGLALVKGVFGG